MEETTVSRENHQPVSGFLRHVGNTGCDLDVDIDFSWDVYSNVSLQEERCLVVSNIERKFCLKFSVDKWVTRVVGMAVNATFNNSSVILAMWKHFSQHLFYRGRKKIS
jgi:hypothetical protein